jgi:hypothetical protein
VRASNYLFVLFCNCLHKGLPKATHIDYMLHTPSTDYSCVSFVWRVSHCRLLRAQVLAIAHPAAAIMLRAFCPKGRAVSQKQLQDCCCRHHQCVPHSSTLDGLEIWAFQGCECVGVCVRCWVRGASLVIVFSTVAPFVVVACRVWALLQKATATTTIHVQ